MKEIEFVEYDSQWESATPLKNQKKLCKDLLAKSDQFAILPYRQDFSIGKEKRISLAVILTGQESEAVKFIRQRADKHGVEIGREHEVTDEYVQRVRKNQLDGQAGCE